MPIVITLVIAEENELVPLLWNGHFAGTGIGAILLLIFRI